MNNIAVKKIEEKLLRRRHEILPVLKNLEQESSAPAGNRRRHSIDEAREESEALLVGRLANLYEHELESIDTALGRIRTGTFGFCRACHQAIEPARLDRFPQAEFCAGCKQMRERFGRSC